MNTANDLTLLVDDLASHWTAPVLDNLKAAGVQPITVDMELEAWRTLKTVLDFEIRRQRAFRLFGLVHLSTVMEQAIRKTTLFVAQQFGYGLVSDAFESRVRRLAGERRATPAEERLFAEIIRQPALRPPFKPPNRTDFAPRLHASALGG
jgi:hypothetical protein